MKHSKNTKSALPKNNLPFDCEIVDSPYHFILPGTKGIARKIGKEGFAVIIKDLPNPTSGSTERKDQTFYFQEHEIKQTKNMEQKSEVTATEVSIMKVQSTESRHAEMVKCLIKEPERILASLKPESVDLWHGATGVCTEAGELLDAVKRHTIYEKPIDRVNVIEELGDLEFYMEQIRQRLGITREETLQGNMEKLATRYHDYKYSNAQANARKDKQ